MGLLTERQRDTYVAPDGGVFAERRRHQLVREMVDPLSEALLMIASSRDYPSSHSIMVSINDSIAQARDIAHTKGSEVGARRFRQLETMLREYVRPIVEYEAFDVGSLFVLGVQHFGELYRRVVPDAPPQKTSLAEIDFERQRADNPWLDKNHPGRIKDIMQIKDYFALRFPQRRTTEGHFAGILLQGMVLSELERRNDGDVAAAIQRLADKHFQGNVHFWEDIAKPETLMGRFLLGGPQPLIQRVASALRPAA